MRVNYQWILAVLSIGIVFASCTNDDDTASPQRPDRGKALLRVVHANPTASGRKFDLYAQYLGVKSIIGSAFQYSEAWPDSQYLSIEANIAPSGEGQYPLYILFAHDSADTADVWNKFNLTIPKHVFLKPATQQTVFAVDSAGLGTWILITDPSLPVYPDTVKAIRFANLVSNANISVRFTANGNPQTLGPLGYGGATGYGLFNNTQYTFEVVDNSTGAILQSRSMAIPQKNAVTLYWDGQNLGRIWMD